jgi:Uma2 family endonuclease
MYQIPKPPAETLPTMYDLPSEDAEEPGLPDEFHDFQPKLLRETCLPPTYPATEIFMGADLNLYYDGRHPQWYKRPDWFLVLGVTPAARQTELRWSYVVWQESVNPFLVVELLSPGTEDEDLGRQVRELGKPPTKWEVYERILRVPFYVLYDRYENQLEVFALDSGRYRQIDLAEPSYWFSELKLGLGIWQGCYQGAAGQWLRWYDAAGNWIPTQAEQTEQERERAEQERERAEQQQQRAEQERERAEQEQERAEQQQQRAEQERERAEQERERAERQQQRAEQERERAEQERERAEQAEQQLALERRSRQQLLDQLQAMGINPDEL